MFLWYLQVQKRDLNESDFLICKSKGLTSTPSYLATPNQICQKRI